MKNVGQVIRTNELITHSEAILDVIFQDVAQTWFSSVDSRD